MSLFSYQSAVCFSVILFCSLATTFILYHIFLCLSSAFFNFFSDGGGGIRTHGTREDSTVFKTASLNRSDTPPENNPNYKGVFSACQQKSSGSVCFNYFPIGAIGPSTQENSTKVSNVPFILLLIFSSWVMIVRMCLLRSTACRRSPMIAIERS